MPRRREARAAFGDDAVLLERLIQRPRHVEIQVLADTHGSCVHLFERECSIQRRHQKIVEESPAAALNPRCAPRWARRRCGRRWRPATTTPAPSSLCSTREGRYYFLEMNTRLQVEHPVTELVAGVDLVQLSNTCN